MVNLFLSSKQKNPHTLRRPSLSVRISWIVKGIKKPVLLYPFYQKGGIKAMASYRKRENGKWEYRISYKSHDGKYKKAEKGGFPTKKAAQIAASEREQELLLPSHISDDVTLYEYFKQWATIHKKPNISPVTWQVYQVTSRNIEKLFPGAKLKNITSSIYQQALNTFAETHSQATVERLNIHIKQCVAMAVHEGIIQKNFTTFAKAVSQQKGVEKETKFLEVDEYENVIAISRDKIKVQSYAVIYLIAVTGMRFAECLGLTWDNVDHDNKLLTVDKTWNYKTNLNFSATKTKSSIRKIPLDDETLKLLKIYQKEHWIHNKENRIFSNISNNAVNKTLRRIVGRNVHAHSLRHTYASFLIAKRIELLSISKILGHENMNVTIEVYAHQLKELEEASNSEVREIFANLGANWGRNTSNP